MSRMTMDTLVDLGINPQSLCYVTPAHDGSAILRRTVIGITSRAYADGRKREHLLADLAREMRLNAFHFEIIGAGWEGVIEHLKAAGATVAHYPGTGDFQADYVYTLDRLRSFDYYLYLGLDEGSMGLLDALAAGVETIVTRQGFHLDIENGITHGFMERSELVEIFRALRDRRERLRDAVSSLTWSTYARQHAIVWRYLLAGRVDGIASALRTLGKSQSQTDDRPVVAGAKNRLRYYLNARNSDFRAIYLRRRKWELRSALSRLKQRLSGSR